MKSSCMFPESFLICPYRLNNVLKSYAPALRNQKQYLNAIMIRHSLEVPFHLFCSLYFCYCHAYIIYTSSLQTPVCKDDVLWIKNNRDSGGFWGFIIFRTFGFLSSVLLHYSFSRSFPFGRRPRFQRFWGWDFTLFFLRFLI